MKRFVLPILGGLLVICLPAIMVVYAMGAGGDKLEARYTTTPPIVDGDTSDAVWADTPELALKNGAKMKAVYTNDEIFILTQWADSTFSATRGGSWSWQDGAWVKSSNIEEGAYNEDRFNIFWNINITDFATKGCITKCHGPQGDPTGAWLENVGERGDMWHMKAARALGAISAAQSGALIVDNHEVTAGTITLNGYTDDKVVTAKDDPDFPFDSEDGGRHGDKFGDSQPMFFHNRNSDKTAPLYMETAPENYIDAMVLHQAEIDSGEAVEVAGLSDAQIAEYWAIYEGFGAIVPERVLRLPAGSRGDTRQSATWSDGVWTAEYQRKLVTGYDDDVQFDDLTKPYYFATTIMDNSGGENHDLRDTLETLVFEKFVPIAELPAAAGYVGSQTCSACHPDQFQEWQRSIHSKMIQNATANPDAVIADFNDPSRPYDLDQVVMTLGTRYRQRYIGKTESDFIVLDGQWNVKKQQWDAAGGGKSWTDKCAGCHSTGYSPDTKEYVEISIGCEACHGPGSEHVAAGGGPGTAIVKSPDVQICGQCHTRGSSPDGEHGYPIGYRPGGELEGKFNHTAYDPENLNTVEWWPDGHAKKHRQQYPEWIHTKHANALTDLRASSHASERCLNCHSADYRLAPEDAKPTLETAQYGLTCVVCHSPHSDSTQPFDSLLREESYDLCVECHTGGSDQFTPGKTVHHPMKEMFEGVGAVGIEAEPSPHFAASASGGPVCASCHMVGTAKSADVGDVASHTWGIIEPAKASAGEPDSCTICHQGSRATMQAVIEERQTVVKQQLAMLQDALDANQEAMGDTDAYKAARTNMTFVASEGSYGIHNYHYARTILGKSFEELTGQNIDSVGTPSQYTLSLVKGLNMIALPLKPVAEVTARSLLTDLDATIVIRLDEARQRFEGFTANHDGDGFAIEGGKGYIVNVLQAAGVMFTGTAWQDASAAPVNPKDSSGWALMVTGQFLEAGPGSYWVSVQNLRTGIQATDEVGSAGAGKYAPVWADLSRAPVVLEGDMLRLAVYDRAGNIVSGPYLHQVTTEEIRLALVQLDSVFGQLIPEHTMLAQNYPNPFNPETWIPYQLAEPGDVVILISDTTGRLVRKLDLGHRSAGVYLQPGKAVHWDGTNSAGQRVASGTYFYTLRVNDAASTRKMVILK